MTLRENGTWDFGEAVLNEHYPTLRADDYHQVLKALKVLVNWRRHDLIGDLVLTAMACQRDLEEKMSISSQTAQERIEALKEASRPRMDMQTIGGRKGDREVVGTFEIEPKPAGGRPDVDLPSLKAFLRGKIGHTYAGILVLASAFRPRRMRDVIFLAPSDPPTLESQKGDYWEPYVNRPFTSSEIGDELGYRSGSYCDNKEYKYREYKQIKNLKAVVHVATNSSHRQLSSLILNSNRYRGIIRDENYEIGSGKFIGFSVMKGGRPSPLSKEWLRNIYAWTSNSQNKMVFVNPTSEYEKRALEPYAHEKYSDPDQYEQKRKRLVGQVSERWAEVIRGTFDRVLELERQYGRPEDKHFVDVLRHYY